MLFEIEARSSSVAGTWYDNTPVKGDTAEADSFLSGAVCWDNAEYALYCRF